MRSATKKKIGKDKAYLEFIRSVPCVVCWGPSYGIVLTGTIAQTELQRSRTEAAHVGERGLSRKCSDRETIPLCAEHHRTGKDAAHRLGKSFFLHHDIDRDALILELNKGFEDNHAGKT